MVEQEADEFLEAAYKLSGTSPDEIDHILYGMDDLLRNGKFMICAAALARADMERLSVTQVLALLTATLPASKELPERALFYERSEAKLKIECPRDWPLQLLARADVSGLCSAHQSRVASCRLCNASPRDLFPDWDQKLAKAKAAGEHKCSACGFVYYKTTFTCPGCSETRPAVVSYDTDAIVDHASPFALPLGWRELEQASGVVQRELPENKLEVLWRWSDGRTMIAHHKRYEVREAV